MFGGEPAVLPAEAYERLRSRENCNGLIDLPPPPPSFQRGQRVRVNRGVLDYRVALYQGMTDDARANVLMTILGRQTRISVLSEWLEAA
jgi:transcription antitermination factor NusG